MSTVNSSSNNLQVNKFFTLWNFSQILMLRIDQTTRLKSLREKPAIQYVPSQYKKTSGPETEKKLSLGGDWIPSWAGLPLFVYAVLTTAVHCLPSTPVPSMCCNEQTKAAIN